MDNLRIVFMGTPDFAVVPFNALVKAGYDVCLAVTQPDSRKGRGKKLMPAPVKTAAEAAGVPAAQPEKIKGNDEFLNKIREIAPDIIIVAAYGRVLPSAILEIPRLGCVNIHASLLPRFRGAAPIQRSIMEGDQKTGVTLMYMAEGLDTGDMIACASTEIGHKNAGELFDELAELGADLLIKTLPSIADGTAERIPQDDSLSCYAPMIEKSEGRIDFSKSAAYIDCHIRGISPSPGAFAEYDGMRMKIREAFPSDENAEAAPGTIIDVSDRGLKVSCGNGVLLITQIQMPGKRQMSISEYLRGNKIEKGIVLR